MSDIVEVFENAGRRADIVIVTGGLGPTEDDLTAGAAASFFGVDMAEKSDALNMINERFSERKRALLKINTNTATPIPNVILPLLVVGFVTGSITIKIAK